MPAKGRLAAAGGLLAALMATASPVASTAARADECSGIMCLFHGRDAQAQPQPQPAAAPDAGAPAATADSTVPSDSKPKPKAKPVAVVTIAADPSEAVRLKPIAAAVTRPRVKIVDVKPGQSADFSLATSLDQGAGPEKARLFPEAMHVLAGDKVHSLDDLKGKTVSFGADGSAGQTVARKAFEAAGVKVAETPLELDNALDGLATGDIDAVVVVAPQPDARLTKLHAPNLHLVAWPQAVSPPEGANATTIDAQAYPGLAKPAAKVTALAVDAVLVESAKGARQPAAKAFLGALTHHASTLGKRGFALLEADAGRRVANNEQR